MTITDITEHTTTYHRVEVEDEDRSRALVRYNAECWHERYAMSEGVIANPAELQKLEQEFQKEQGGVPAHLEAEVEGIGLVVADLCGDEWEMRTYEFFVSVSTDLPVLVEVEVYEPSAVEDCWRTAKALHQKAHEILSNGAAHD